LGGERGGVLAEQKEKNRKLKASVLESDKACDPVKSCVDGEGEVQKGKNPLPDWVSKLKWEGVGPRGAMRWGVKGEAAFGVDGTERHGFWKKKRVVQKKKK